VAPIFGIDRPPVAITTLGASMRRCRLQHEAFGGLLQRSTLHGMRQCTSPAAHSSLSMSMICSAESSQNSWPLCFSW
jgi:hypothetical protein